MSTTKVYIAVRGGVVQGVRVRTPTQSAECVVVDYDDCDDDFRSDEDFERSRLNGSTWEDLSADTIAAY